VTGLQTEIAPAIVEPLAAASVDGFRADIRAIEEPGPCWTSIADLARGVGRGGRHRLIQRAAGAGAPCRIAQVWEVESLAWFVGLLVGGSLLSGPALPSPDPEGTWVRFGEQGLAEGLAIAADAGTVLPAGPDDGRRVLHALLEPIIEAPGVSATRVLWLHAGDRIADALLWCGDALRARGEAREMAAALLAPGVPYSVPLGIEAGGFTRVRRTCCLSRLTDDGTTCEGCPRGSFVRRRSTRWG
jgi:hypothetical protein